MTAISCSWRRTVCFAYCLLTLSGCAWSASKSEGPAFAAQSAGPCLDPLPVDPVAADRSDYRIRAGDDLDISFYLSPEFNQDVVVRPDGKITLHLVGDLPARGMNPQQLADEVDQAYLSELRPPSATVLVKNSPSRVVYVEGEVTHPGAVQLYPQLTALEAIAQSGGMTDAAGPNNVILARRDSCGEVYLQRLDLAQALKGKNSNEDVALLPSDLLIVPRSGIANLNLVVKQYIKDVLPIEPYMSAAFPVP
jgi:protein involved in polysaccharide export with SLBB domain